MDNAHAHDGTFESVRTPLAERNWQTGDEFLSSMMGDLDSEREPLCRIPDPRLEQGWALDSTDAETASPGEIWQTRGVITPKLVVIRLRDTLTPEGPVFEVLPISFQHHYAGPFDYLIDRDESPLGMGFMIQAHEPIPALASSLDGRVTVLTVQQWEEAQLLLAASLGLLRGEENREAREAVRWIPQGHPITRRDDTRIRFREHERENLAYLVGPAERALSPLMEAQPTSIVVRALQLLTEHWQSALHEWTSSLRRTTEQVAERVAKTAEEWEVAFAALAPQPIRVGGAGEDDDKDALVTARQRFRQDEGTQVYPRESEPPTVPGCWFDILATETGCYLRIRVDDPDIPLTLGALEVDEEPVFVHGVFPSTPDFVTGFVRRLPVLPETSPEIALPFHRQGQTDVVTFQLEPFREDV